MNKTIKRNVVVSAILAIMLCVSLIAGATFALFTSESKVNIAVTSGKVSVVANIDETSVQTKQLYDTQYEVGKGNMFMGEDVATFTAAGLELNNVVPGDGIKFNIVVKNESNVTVQYRTIISCENDDGLFAGLNITVGNNENYSGVTLVSNWAQLAVGSADEIVPVTIELPEGAGNEYQEKTCAISYKVEAVQGNAQVENPEDGVLYIYNVYDLKNFRNAVNSGNTFSGKTVKLAADVDLNNEEWTPIGNYDNAFKGVFDGQDYTISNLYINDSEGESLGLFGVAQNATIKGITINNVDITGYQLVASIVAYPYVGCYVSNCHVTGEIDITALYAYAGGIVAYGYVKEIDNCSVTPNDIGYITAQERNAVGGISAWLLEDCDGKVTNCIVKDLVITGWTNVGSITGFIHRENSIIGCTAENIVITKTRDGGNAAIGYVAGGWSYKAGTNITISNNTVRNVELNGNYILRTEGNYNYGKGINVMFGAEYDGKYDADIDSVFVMENNILENVTDNRYIEVDSASELQNFLNMDLLEVTKFKFASDITGDVTVTQKAGVNVEINGDNYKFTGLLTVDGDGRQSGAETLLIENVNFVAEAGADSCIYSPDRNSRTPAKYSYSHNVTVQNCTFTDIDGVVNCAAIRHGDGGDKNWNVIECDVDSTMHSLLQINNVAGKLLVQDCEVNSKNGINLNSCTNVELVGNKFDTKGYCVRFGVNSGSNPDEEKTFIFTNNTLTSACDDGDAIIIFRLSAANANTTVTMSGNTMTGDITYSGADNVNIVD